MITLNSLNVAQKHAKHYTARLGWGLIKIKDNKRALETAWQDNPVTDPAEAVEKWSHPPYGMGIHLGVSGICTLDVDHLEYARIAFAAVGIDLDAVMADAPVKIKGRNSKPVYRVPAGMNLGYAAVSWPHPTEKDGNGRPKRVTVVEFRAGPGRYDVLPPTKHPDTKAPYEWEGIPPREKAAVPVLDQRLTPAWENLDQTAATMRAACPWATEEARPQQPRRTAQPYTGESVIDAFNAAYTVQEILERNGYKRRGEGKYLSPNSSTKAPGVTVYQDASGKTRAHTYHGSDAWADGKGHDAFGLYTELEHGGDTRAALKAAADLLGMSRPAAPVNVKSDPQPQSAAELWAAHGNAVLAECMDKLSAAAGHAKTRQGYMDVLVAVHAAAHDGDLVQRGDVTRIEFGGLERLAERMLYRGRLRDLRAALDYLAALGFFGRVVSTDPADKFAPLAVEVSADPRQLPILRFQGGLNLMSTSYTTRRRVLAATAEDMAAQRPPRTPRLRTYNPENATPLHDARWVLYWIKRGARSVEDVCRMGHMTARTVRRHLAALEAAGLVVDWTAAEGADAAIRAEVESTPAYRAARLRYLEEAARFGSRGRECAERVGAKHMAARRSSTANLAAARAGRLMDGETCAAVYGIGDAA